MLNVLIFMAGCTYQRVVAGGPQDKDSALKHSDLDATLGKSDKGLDKN